MKQLLHAGKYIFISGFSIYILLHFSLPDKGAAMLPEYFPAPLFWNYFGGICILAFMISCFIGKYDKLAALLMALYVFICAIFIHVPKMQDPMEFVNIFRAIILIGALLMYAQGFAKDTRFFS